jgi:simple sugar transport system permease protein
VNVLKRGLLRVLPSVAGVAFALILGAVLVKLLGKSPLGVLGKFQEDYLWADTGMVIFYATVYSFTGLSVAYAFQAGLFNIGGEGQLTAGAFTLGVFAAALPAGTPGLVAVPACLVVTFAAGAAWAAVPAVLRARLGVHEVISTILMNRIAPSAAIFLLNNYRRSHPDLGEAMHTAKIVDGAKLSTLERISENLEGTDASTAAFLAIGAAVLTWLSIHKTRGGYALRAVGHNAEAAHAGGIAVPTIIVKALLVSGGLAALASVPFILGAKHYYEHEMLAGAGFAGIAVAVLGGNDPWRVLVAATLLAFLTQAGTVVNGGGPNEIRKEIVQVLQAVVILSVLIAQTIARRMVGRAEARRAVRATG